MTLKVRILRCSRRLFIILVCLTKTWFSEKRLISTRCIHGFMSNLIKKSWTDSKQELFHNEFCFIFIQLIRLDPCPLINEIMDLVKREEQLVDRGVRTSNLSGLRQRILTRYMQLIRTPAHNPEITRFENQLPVPVLHSAKPKEYKRGGANTEFCHSCRNYLPRTKFSLSSGVVSFFLTI